jgi:RNA polymerase sigma factor (sigma-70 family)
MPRRALPADELREAYRENVSAVYAFLAYSVSHETAEDLTAATFERVVRSWKRFDPSRSSERTWILAIARNLLTDHYRRQRHRTGPSLDEHPALAERLAATEDPIAAHLSFDSVKGWLRGLAPREREVLALRFGADLGTRDIAAWLGVSEDNVHQISSRALRKLRERLAEPEFSGSVARTGEPGRPSS